MTQCGEESKPSALSVSFVQEENEQDDAPGFTATGSLSDFLIRRQLLTMEGKRIQEIIVESDADIKAAKDHLSGYRDAVLAGLPSRLAGNEWPKRRPKLRELPRTAERYIRIKMKRRFASVKSTLERIGTILMRLASKAAAGIYRKPGSWTLGRPGLLRTILACAKRDAFEKNGSRLR